MAVNEKKLLEKFITIEVALNALAKVCMDAKKELSDIPQPSRRKSLLKESIEKAWIRKEKAEARYRERKLQNQ